MTLAILFWILLIIGLIFGGWAWSVPTATPFTRWGGGLLIIVLLAILGWKVFGAPVHGG